MKKAIFTISLLLILCMTLNSCQDPSKDNKEDFKFIDIEPDEYGLDTMDELPNDFTLVWTDEFNYTGSVDPSKWNYEIGNGGWGNGEAQYYTNSDANSYVSDGHLTITAKKENYGGSNYTSARLTTKLKGDFKYGYVEVRAKLPTTAGCWPAIWMMPTDSVYGGWPNSGEIDIMETSSKYNNFKTVIGTLHTNVSGGAGTGSRVSVDVSEWHNYGLLWDEDSIQIQLDGKTYYTFAHLSSYTYKQWPFDQRFFVILNIAMGGTLGGNIDPSFISDEMLVDYVRIYKHVDKTDKEKPSGARITGIVPGSNSINITWEEALDNQGIKQYDIVVNNKIIGATVSRSYEIKDLEPGTTYIVSVVPVDYNKNWTLTSPIEISTLSEQVIPGRVDGASVSSIDGDAVIVSGSDTTPSNVLKVNSDTTITYNVKCKKEGTYEMILRLAATLSCNISVNVYSNNNLIFTEVVSVGKSYGKYKDVALSDKLDLPSGDLTIKLTCMSNTAGSAMLLSYFDIK